MRRAAKKDENHNQIKKALEKVGAVVLDTHAIPGLLDALVGFRGKWWLFEIKDGGKPKSARKLTEEEQATFTKIGDRAPVHIVESVDEALSLITK